MSRGKKKKAELTLTDACQKLLTELEKDLWKALEEDPAPGEEDRRQELRAEWKEAKDEGRTAHDFDAWCKDLVTQIGASWVLSCVFARFVEDNELLDRPRLSGPVHEDSTQDRRQRAIEAERAYYAEHPDHGEREYLINVFRELCALPGLDELFDERHALLWRLTPRIEGGRQLLGFFRELDDETGQLRWSFADPKLDTRFLGDLYQDLSESARKTYALLQTPHFVEEFILDRTIEPAIETFGLEVVRMIDPTCGSGHFLLGSFSRLFAHWQRNEPGENSTELARRALDAIHGVDVNPFAAVIARFRLLVASLRACGTKRLADAPRFPIHVAVGDSLLHGHRFSDLRGPQRELWDDPFAHLYPHEQDAELRLILGQQYHAVVGNPPYITPKDPAQNELYRARYGSCSGKYALSVPFIERFVELGVRGDNGSPAGFVGKITSNSFMKREFGKKLIEEFFGRWDLTHVIDTSGAYIPGHGTPTVVLFLRNQLPATKAVRAVLGIRGEPSAPAVAAKGHVWTAILDQVDRVGSESDYVSVEDMDRTEFGKHPWCLGGGGATTLLETLEITSSSRLRAQVVDIGPASFPGLDEIFVAPRHSLSRAGVPECLVKEFVTGDVIRDWSVSCTDTVIAPYDSKFDPLPDVQVEKSLLHRLWPYRASLLGITSFGSKQRHETGERWYEWYRWLPERYRQPISIAFAFVATHNHFILDRGGKAFNRSAPVIKLPPDATEDDHFALLALLNSSAGCFWMKQVFYPKATASGDISTEKMRPEANRYEISGTGLLEFPVPDMTGEARGNLISLARRLDILGRKLAEDGPRSVLVHYMRDNAISLRSKLTDLDGSRVAWRERMVLLQEELDWLCYELYGLLSETTDLKVVMPGHADNLAEQLRPFRWYRNSSRVHLPEHCVSRFEARAKAIATSSELRLLEDPMYKRLWLGRQGVYGSARTSFPDMVEDACDDLMLDRIEALPHWTAPRPAPITRARLTEVLEADEHFLTLLRVRTGEDAPDVDRAVAALVERQSVPFLPALYLNPAGLRKRESWEETWTLQRIEDPFRERQEGLLRDTFGGSPIDQKRILEHVACWLNSDKLSKDKHITDDEVVTLTRQRSEWRAIDQERQRSIGGATPLAPPKYKPADFLSSTFWSLRGKLDVPKERFISYPYCSPEGDDTLLVGWAGWDHAQRAAALVQVLTGRKTEGWTGERLAPILQGLDELVPWLFQWHGEDHGNQYRQFVESEMLAAGLTLEQVQAWRPLEGARRGRRKKAALGS